MIYKVSIRIGDDCIKPESLGNDRGLYIFLIHFVLVGDSPVVSVLGDRIGIMVDSFLLTYTVDRIELLVAYKCCVSLESVDLRDVSLEEDFKSIQIYELGCIGNDLGEEAFILLITSELSLAVLRSSDDN